MFREGVVYKYFEGDFHAVPDFARLGAKRSGRLSFAVVRPDVPPRALRGRLRRVDSSSLRTASSASSRVPTTASASTSTAFASSTTTASMRLATPRERSRSSADLTPCASATSRAPGARSSRSHARARRRRSPPACSSVLDRRSGRAGTAREEETERRGDAERTRRGLASILERPAREERPNPSALSPRLRVSLSLPLASIGDQSSCRSIQAT